MKLVAIYRSPTYSPLQHRVNDTAILDAAVARLQRDDWQVTQISEIDVERSQVPAADLYLNMAQGARASEQLLTLESDGRVVVNRPSGVLSCHRHHMVRQLGALPFPRTLILPTSGEVGDGHLRAVCPDHQPVWVKRGDVHAERPEDVVAVSREGVAEAVSAFGRRGIPWVALQEHVPGPIVKFYGVADGRFFRWYGAQPGVSGAQPRVDVDRLQAIAFAAADCLGVDVFGGDVAFPEPDRPVLIDLNDWPSFAPFRDEAARAIAEYVHDRVTSRMVQ